MSMILASSLPATERREMPRLLPHSARSPFCLYTRIMLAFSHCCGRHLADQQSRIKLCSLLCKAHPPYLMTSASEWKLPLCGRIIYRHCWQPKLPTFLYSSNTTSWRLMRRANNNNNLSRDVVRTGYFVVFETENGLFHFAKG